MALFLHFGPNTFTDSEWGTGHADPSVFAPSALDAGQWARIAAQGGFGRVVLTAKHHDGFCLWPSALTEYSVAASPWQGGAGDVVAELAAAARAEGLGLGLYLSPWDRHEPVYGDTIAYNEHYLGQMTELLTRYGDIAIPLYKNMINDNECCRFFFLFEGKNDALCIWAIVAVTAVGYLFSHGILELTEALYSSELEDSATCHFGDPFGQDWVGSGMPQRNQKTSMWLSLHDNRVQEAATLLSDLLDAWDRIGGYELVQLFVPELPQRKLDCIKRLGFGFDTLHKVAHTLMQPDLEFGSFSSHFNQQQQLYQAMERTREYNYNYTTAAAAAAAAATCGMHISTEQIALTYAPSCHYI
ncbi:hypothetical protein ACJX0J_011399, partial [Zea mays]